MTSHIIRCKVNGHSAERLVSSRTTVAEFIRDDLGLTGTKVSCQMQVCGTCTVLVDGKPVSSCSVLAYRLDGKEIQTIEGMDFQGLLSDVQQAFVDEFSMQCGYCTPGFVMMVTVLLQENRNPTDEEIEHHLDGNLCRCTGYKPILEATRAVIRKRNLHD